MYATAIVDLTENGTVPVPDGMAVHEAEYATVRIYPAGEQLDHAPYAERYAEVLAAAARCRLLVEGHCHRIEVFPSVSWFGLLTHDYFLPAEGSELTRKETT